MCGVLGQPTYDVVSLVLQGGQCLTPATAQCDFKQGEGQDETRCGRVETLLGVSPAQDLFAVGDELFLEGVIVSRMWHQAVHEGF